MGQEMPIFVLSRRSSIKDINYAFDIGVSDYIQKPFTKEDLITSIEKVVSGFEEL